MISSVIHMNGELAALTKTKLVADCDRSIRMVETDIRSALRQSSEQFVGDLHILVSSFHEVGERLTELAKQLTMADLAAKKRTLD
jgi:hypothetical protein